MSQIYNFDQLKNKIEQVVQFWESKLHKEDVSKINLTLLEDIFVDYFGTKTAVKHLVKIQKGNQGEFSLTPFDPGMIKLIYQAILDYKIKWAFSIQQETIYIASPIITTEKKLQISKDWKITAENCRIQIRKLRHDFLNYWKNEQKLAREELILKQQKVQKIVDEVNHKIDIFLKEKIEFLFKV